MILIPLTGKRWEIVRCVPKMLEFLYGTDLKIHGKIPKENCIIICNHQSGILNENEWPHNFFWRFFL